LGSGRDVGGRAKTDGLVRNIAEVKDGRGQTEDLSWAFEDKRIKGEGEDRPNHEDLLLKIPLRVFPDLHGLWRHKKGC